MLSNRFQHHEPTFKQKNTGGQTTGRRKKTSGGGKTPQKGARGTKATTPTKAPREAVAEEGQITPTKASLRGKQFFSILKTRRSTKKVLYFLFHRLFTHTD